MKMYYILYFAEMVLEYRDPFQFFSLLNSICEVKVLDKTTVSMIHKCIRSDVSNNTIDDFIHWLGIIFFSETLIKN